MNERAEVAAAAELLGVRIDVAPVRIRMALQERLRNHPEAEPQLRAAADLLVSARRYEPPTRTPPTLRHPLPGGQRRSLRKGQPGFEPTRAPQEPWHEFAGYILLAVTALLVVMGVVGLILRMNALY